MKFGTLKTKVAEIMPVYGPSYSETICSFSDLQALRISYRTSSEAVKHLIPEELQIEDEPLVTQSLFNWGFSSIGAYTESMTEIEVTYKGKKYDYAVELVLDNEGALFLGREKYGMPKVIGKVVFDPAGTSPAPSGYLEGHIERPYGSRIIHFTFRPTEKLHGVKTLPKPDKAVLALRVIPNPIIGQPPTLREFVALYLNITEAEVWSGVGSVEFTGASNFSAAHKFPVIRYERSTFLRHAQAFLGPDPVVHQLK